jgi:hypothetical protein
MKVEVKLNGHNFIALIDIGSTHNFLHPIVARRVRLNVSKHKPIIVNITNGSRLWSEGSCSDIKLILIQGDQFITQVYVLFNWKGVISFWESSGSKVLGQFFGISRL